ncbi:MAG: VWA domain-containing protein [Deltaproteobacteria bacterium]|nr:VWA domain-containing protein [Deltaproteobacteria bacterium]
MNDNIMVRWMKRHSLALVAVLGGVAGIAYATARAPAKTAAPPLTMPAAEGEAARDAVQDTVQIALLLDTSSSMDGLINQARSHLWNLVDRIGRMTRVVDGKVRGVKVELALYEYGNDTLPESSGYIRQVLPFTTDLDRVSEQLHGLFTNGGSEFVGQAITRAVGDLGWSKDPSAMRFVFVAGNEEFDQGPIKAVAAMDAAAKKDINVQLIFCGDADWGTWDAAAKLAKSDLARIDQNHVAVHIAAPQDDEILRLSTQLNGTYLAYGRDGAGSYARQAKADASSAKMGKKVAIERAQLKAKPGKYANDKWDLVDAHAKNAKVLEQTSDDNLPAEMRGKELAEKQQILDAKLKERAELQAKIGKLEQERVRHVEAERRKKQGDEEKSLETELLRSAEKLATRKGYKL